MKLKVLIPAQVALEQEVDQLTALSPDGSFCLLEHHADFVSALAPGLLRYRAAGEEQELALGEGTLVKCGEEVLVSVQAASQPAPASDRGLRLEPGFWRDREAEEKTRRIIAGMEEDFTAAYFQPAEEEENE